MALTATIGELVAVDKLPVKADKPNINGGNYSAIDTQDGYFIIRDIPTMSSVAKGERGNESPIDEGWLGNTVKYHSKAYEDGKIAFPLHIGHHDDMGIKKLEFAGLFKPTRVETMKVNGNERPVIFSDWKVKADVFRRINAGEMPYRSPEIRNWGKTKISSVAILDTEPPHFEFPMTTIGTVTIDPAAKFESDLSPEYSIAKFEEKEIISFAADDKPMKKANDSPESCCEHCAAYSSMLHKLTKMMGITFEGAHMAEPVKTDATPVNQPNAPLADHPKAVRFEDDPKIAARFAAMEEKLTAQEKKFSEAEKASKAKELSAKAFEDLREYDLGEKTKASIVKFASEGEDRLKEFVETLKESMPRRPAGTFAEAEVRNINANDPVLAKFAQQGPDALARAASAFAEYKILKGKVSSYSLSAEQHIERALKANTVKEG